MTAYSTIAVRLLLVALLAAGVGGAIYVAVQAGADDDGQQVAGQPTPSTTLAPATNTPPPATATAVPPTEPRPTGLPPTDVPPVATRDTRIPIREIPRADQIQLGKDGRYFLADRGDGCTWVEALRFTDSELGEIVVLRTDCPVDFQYNLRPGTGEVAVSVP